MAVLFCLFLISVLSPLPTSAASVCPMGGDHDYEIVSKTSVSCTSDDAITRKCKNCGVTTKRVYQKAKGHTGTAYNGDCTKGVRCTTCGSTIGSQRAHTYASSSATKCSYSGRSQTRTVNTGDSSSSRTPNTVSGLYAYAYKIYKIARSIAVPLSILSLASCGFKILGSIFFGNYASAAGTDMMKAQKQAVYTVIALLVIVFLPQIFNEASSFFRQYAWKP